MNKLRTQEIDGRFRNIFLCDCETEIYFIKYNEDFIKYEIVKDSFDEDYSIQHKCNFIRKIETTCFKCQQPIKIHKNPNYQEWNQYSPKWLKENFDGSVHKHPRKKKEKQLLEPITN